MNPEEDNGTHKADRTEVCGGEGAPEAACDATTALPFAVTLPLKPYSTRVDASDA